MVYPWGCEDLGPGDAQIVPRYREAWVLSPQGPGFSLRSHQQVFSLLRFLRSPERQHLTRPCTALSTALAGDDTIIGKRHNERVMAMSGNDYVRLGSSNDVAFGEDGDDWLHGNDGRDMVSGGAGNDHPQGGGGNDRVYGGSGVDELDGDAGNDLIVRRVRRRRGHRRRGQRHHLPRHGDRHHLWRAGLQPHHRQGRRRRRPVLLLDDQRRPGARTADLHRQEGPARRHRAVRGRGQVAVQVRPSHGGLSLLG